jgi:hypothetical protein
MKRAYIEKRFTGEILRLIKLANSIVEEYAVQGFTLTLRQLYYQMVAGDHLANTQREYNRLGRIIVDARMAGLLDWEAIEDRTRHVRSNQHWATPREIINAAVRSYCIDKWVTQKVRIECWIEKDALTGVIEGVCRRLDIPFFSCRGYASVSEVWRAGLRMVEHCGNAQAPVVLHLADHDPSGIDMTRDVMKRLGNFLHADLEQDLGWEIEPGKQMLTVVRVALTMAQVEKHNPPPNPAKLTDSRARMYRALHGDSSWELDALDPRTIADLIESWVLRLRDEDLWAEAIERENTGREALRRAAESMRL